MLDEHAVPGHAALPEPAALWEKEELARDGDPEGVDGVLLAGGRRQRRRTAGVQADVREEGPIPRSSPLLTGSPSGYRVTFPFLSSSPLLPASFRSKASTGFPPSRGTV